MFMCGCSFGLIGLSGLVGLVFSMAMLLMVFFNPDFVLNWGKKRSKDEALKTYGIGVLLSLMFIFISFAGTVFSKIFGDNDKNTSKPIPAVTGIDKSNIKDLSKDNKNEEFQIALEKEKEEHEQKKRELQEKQKQERLEKELKEKEKKKKEEDRRIKEEERIAEVKRQKEEQEYKEKELKEKAFKDSIEYSLALINAEGNLSDDDITIDRFRNLLNQLSENYSESKQTIGDQSVKAMQILKKEGVSESVLNIMEGMSQICPYKAPNQKYSEILAIYCESRTRMSHEDAVVGVRAFMQGVIHSK
jgi:hypothetical protein